MKNSIKIKSWLSPPKTPSCRIIREGTLGDCLKCGSTTIKRFIWFGPSIGCIQPECENYYEKYN